MAKDRNGNYMPDSFPDAAKKMYGVVEAGEETERMVISPTPVLSSGKIKHEAHVTGARREKMSVQRYDYFPAMPVMEAYARVAHFGAIKYDDDDNWYKGLPLSQLFGSLLRHGWAFMWGEDRDPESGLMHTDHMLWNVVAMVTFVSENRMDDRFSNRLKDRTK